MNLNELLNTSNLTGYSHIQNVTGGFRFTGPARLAADQAARDFLKFDPSAAVGNPDNITGYSHIQTITAGFRCVGPCRPTPVEAAEDYLCYINGTTPAPWSNIEAEPVLVSDPARVVKVISAREIRNANRKF